MQCLLSKTQMSFVAILLLLSLPLSAQITVDRFMGINTLREDPVKRMKAVGFIREYHSWYLNEGNPSQDQPDFSPSYPNAVYRWNKAYQDLTYTRFDEFYEEIRNTHDIQIAPSFLGNLFQIVDPLRDTFAADNGIVQEEMPIKSGDPTTLPSSYIAHAAYLYHYAARYGHTTFSTNDFNNLIVPRTHPEEIPLTGLGMVEYMESWNEQDKWWWQGTNPNTYFSPQEYTAMLSADYDGHGGTLGPGVGIKNADPNMKVVMGGLAEANLDYIREMVDWSIDNRKGFGPNIDTIPFQVLNIHHYIGNNSNFLQSTQGVSPEHADLRGFLTTFADYRDSLNEARDLDLEIWLSEFGYDTYGPGSTGQPVVIAPQLGSNDSYEVQGQWITRIYLEALAADIDRAMLFFLRDEQTPYTGLYSSSGLLENAANDYKPKNSWFYTYTMKNVLTDMKFVADISPCGDTTCARVYEFVAINNPQKKVYAVWSPTSSAKEFNYVFDHDDVEGATLIEMELPSIWGKATDLEEENPSISVSERPVFIVKNGNPFYGQTCQANMVLENPTCSSINVRLNAPDNSGRYQLWYIQGDFMGEPFSHRLATLVDESLVPSDSVITVANLDEGTEYTFFLFPEGVGQSEMNKYCQIKGSTTVTTCKIPIDTLWIYDDYKNHINWNGLFDNQNDFDPMCEANPGFPSQNDLWGFNFNPNDSMHLSLDLQAYYFLDALTLHDEGSRGFFTIQTADSPNGPWTTVLDYLTIDYQIWKTITNVFPADKPIRYLRFIAEKNDAAKVGELFLCGRLSNFDPDILPGVAVNGQITEVTCESMKIQWEHPFDNDIFGYKVLVNGTGLGTFPFAAPQIIPLANLDQATTYNVDIITVDAIGQESADTLKLSATTLEGIDLCKIPLNISMIFDHSGDLGESEKLVNEQEEYDPKCEPLYFPPGNHGWGPYPFGQKKHVSLDLQAYYTIDELIMHDGGSANGHVDVLIADSPNGPWTNIISYDAISFNGWITFANPTPGQFVRYIRFEASADSHVLMGEIFICGEENPNHNPDIKPGKGRNGQINGVSCDTVGLEWAHPFDMDILEYQIFGGPAIEIVPYDGNDPVAFNIHNLQPNSSYTFKVVTVDMNLNESGDSLCFDVTTFADGECDLICNFSCPCAICLRPNWLKLNYPTTYSAQFDSTKLVNEQDKVPFCGAVNPPGASDFWGYAFDPTIHAPAEVEIDLQEVYQIDKFHFFERGGSVKGYIEIDYKDENDQWVRMANDSTGFYSWNVHKDLDIITQFFRIRLLDDNAGIGEIGICGTPYESCPINLDLPDPITQSDTFNAQTITSSATIAIGTEVGYFAETSITLFDGFHVVEGTKFIAKIESCANNLTNNSPNLEFAVLQTFEPNPSENQLAIFPNPFQQNTTIAYQVAAESIVHLDIFDANGRIIKTLIHNDLKPKGSYQTHFYINHPFGGLLLARLRIGTEILIKKIVLLNQ